MTDDDYKPTTTWNDILAEERARNGDNSPVARVHADLWPLILDEPIYARESPHLKLHNLDLTIWTEERVYALGGERRDEFVSALRNPPGAEKK